MPESIACQRDAFSIPESITYLNTAYMAPLPAIAQAKGQEALTRLSQPYQIKAPDFFDPVKRVRSLFNQLIDGTDPERVALIPAASYGLSNVAHQLKPTRGSEIVVLQEQFPSNYYPWQRVCQEYGCTIKTVEAPAMGAGRAQAWTNGVLEAIGPNTAMVAMSPLFWADGSVFDLMAIKERCKQFGVLWVLDGSQTIGAFPFSMKTLQPDALIVAGYKWLLGPYGSGLAYYGDYFDEGKPMEETWFARKGADDFRNVSQYKDEYLPKGQRYSAGQHPAMVQVAIQEASLQWVVERGAADIHRYCQQLTQPLARQLANWGWESNDADHQAGHLLGIKVPKGVDMEQLKQRLEAASTYVSLRGESLRISTYLFNDQQDIDRLLTVLAEFKA